MNIELLRKLDFFVGVPLCFIITVIRKALAPVFQKLQDEKPKNILFIELSEMGSAVLADPALVKAKNQLGANVFFAIFNKNSCGLEILRSIPQQNVFIMPDRTLFDVAFGSVRFLFWTRKNRIDTIVDLELFSRFTALLMALSGAVRRVGFDAFFAEGLYRGDLLTHKVVYNPHQHISKNFIALVNALLAPAVEVPYSKTIIRDEEITPRKLTITPEEKQVMLQKISKTCPLFKEDKYSVVLFNTNSSDLIPLRRWPQEYYACLAEKILEQYQNVIILLTGNSREREGQEVIVKKVNSERCVNFAGITAITDLPALYAVSAFMLTNDSGPAHFASVTDMPVFVFFGPETPYLYGPLGEMTPIYSGFACSPCVTAANHRKSICTKNVCLTSISPEHVLGVLTPSLKRLA